MLSKDFDFEKAKQRFIKLFGIESYMKQFKAQLDELPCSNSEKFETYYKVRAETLKKYAV